MPRHTVAGRKRSTRAAPAGSASGAAGAVPAAGASARPTGAAGRGVDEVLVVGRVVKPHGVRGELVIEVRTDSPDERFAVGAVLAVRPRTGPVRDLTVSSVRPHLDRLLIFFEDVLGRDAAEGLRGALLTVARDDLPAIADPEEFYDHQLEGLRAELADGVVIGEVSEVLHGPGGEVLVVSRPDGTEALIPFVTAIVPEVDLPGGRLIVTPPEGLLDP